MGWFPYGTWIATAAALGLAAVVGANRGFGFSIGVDGVQTVALLVLLPLALALYGRVRPALSALVVPSHCFAQFAAFNLAILVLQFPLASLNFPAIDPQLAAIDKALGGDWPSHFAWLTSAPVITKTATGIYQALLLQIPLTCAVVGLLDPKRLQIFVLANTVGLGATVAIATLLPAEGALGYWETPGLLVRDGCAVSRGASWHAANTRPRSALGDPCISVLSHAACCFGRAGISRSSARLPDRRGLSARHHRDNARRWRALLRRYCSRCGARSSRQLDRHWAHAPAYGAH